MLSTAVVLGFLHFARAPLVVVLVAIILAFILTPLVDLLQKIHLPRSVAALFATLALLASLYGIVAVSYSHFVSFVQDLPKYSGQIRQLIVHVRETVPIEKITQPNAVKEAQKPVKVETVPDWTAVFGPVGQVTEIFFYMAFIPFLIYFMLTWQEHIRAATVRLFDEAYRTTAHSTLGDISLMVRRFIIGNAFVGLLVGTVSLVVFGILHIPDFYFIAYISGFLSLVPYLGVLLALVPPLAAGLQGMHSAQFVAIVVTVLGLHLLSMNVLYARFLGRSLELNPLAASLSLLFWGWMWGAVGLVLAIPIIGGLKIVFDHIKPLKPYAAWLGYEEIPSDSERRRR